MCCRMTFPQLHTALLTAALFASYSSGFLIATPSSTLSPSNTMISSFWQASRPRHHRRLPEIHASSEDSKTTAEDSNVDQNQPTNSNIDDTKEKEKSSDDILNSPAFLKRKVEVLQADLAALQLEIDDANALYLANKNEWSPQLDKLNEESRLMQDRFTKLGANQTELATVEVVNKMLHVIDTYERAFNTIDATTDEERQIVSDYKLTFDKMMECFVELNVTKVETVGAEFNYDLHQAVMQLPSDEYEEGVVCQELAPGWICGERLIRPAMVAVSSA